MTTLLTNRQSRRRGITFTILIAITLLLMAFSGNPYIQEAQRGLSFAMRPFQGAIADAADSVSGVVSALSEIETLRIDNASLRDENERLANENARLQAVKHENDELTAALQLQSGFDHETVATRVIGRDSLDTRQVVTLDKGSDDGIALGDIVIVQGGALAGRVTDVGPTFAKVTLISDSSSTVVGQLLGSGKTGEIVGEASGVLIMRNIDSTAQIGTDEEVFTAGIELTGGIGRHPQGAGGGQRRRRRARRQRRRPDGVPRTRGEPRLVRGGARDHGLRRRAAPGRRAGGAVQDHRDGAWGRGALRYTPAPKPRG
jgi:rod shape-determining protein MreC